uniref:Zinc-binding protein A33-like n=1 Tax=Gouania willdenowi TaxID=441366 RepID=A0A8C5FY13_GOUWI
MASISEEDLICSLCSGIFSLPVILKCKHSFCRACLVDFWECAISRVCPMCGLEVPSGKPLINLELKLAVEALQAQRNEEVCPQHNEKMQIFCHNDEELICAVCRVNKQHKVHECSPVEEAAQNKRVGLFIYSVNTSNVDLHKLKTSFPEQSQTIQRCEIETAIKDEFEKLHQFLREEENRRLKQLRQEEETKVQVMNKKLEMLRDQITRLSSAISDAERDLQATDVPFLLVGLQPDIIEVKSPIYQPQCVRDILINYADHLASLRVRVWKAMTSSIYDAPITLDPNTAHSNLKISPDLRSVHYSKQQPLPDNPERCTSQVCVLGAPGFTSGKHHWTVDVGQGKQWYIGVASESIKRKITTFLTPSEGFWIIGRSNGDTLCAQATPCIKLTPKQMPVRVSVELDYDKGKVIFTNAADLTLLHTFKGKFKEKVFPYFSPGLLEDGENLIPLTICPVVINQSKLF